MTADPTRVFFAGRMAVEDLARQMAFMNRQRMPVVLRKTGGRGETYGAMFSLFMTR